MVFQEYVDTAGLEEISQVFGKGVKIEVGDMLPSSHYAERIKVIPKAWEKTFEVNPSENDAVRASCIEFVLALAVSRRGQIKIHRTQRERPLIRSNYRKKNQNYRSYRFC